MTLPLTGISSMATRALLADLASAYRAKAGLELVVESVGGVDAARRVAAGEGFDLVVLAADAIDRLAASGHVAGGTRTDLVRSDVAIAVRAGTPPPVVDTEATLRDAVLRARSIGYSTGPSGVALSALFERWGIAAQVAPRMVQARAGVPVGSLVASGEVELGFQQRSELIHLHGIEIVGPMPPDIAIVTVFTAAQASTSRRAPEVRALLDFLASPETAQAKRRQGMEPA